MIISERIFYVMEQKNITQLELSKRTGIATSNISDWKIITTPFTESRWRGSCFIHREWKRWERISYELFSEGFSK